MPAHGFGHGMSFGRGVYAGLPAGVDIVGISELPYTARTETVWDKPAGGVQQGDLLAVFSVFGQPTGELPVASAPLGWSDTPGTRGPVAVSGFTAGLYCWYDIAGASEPASYTFSHAGNASYSTGGVMVAFRGFAAADPFDPISTWATGAGQDPVAPGLTTAADLSALVYAALLFDSAAGASPPTNFAELHVNAVMYVGTATMAVAGPTGAVSTHFPNQGGTAPWGASLFAIKTA